MRRKLHRHDLSREHNFSHDMGKLIPTNFRMCYPGDIVRQRSNFFVRVSPLLAPIYSKVMIKAESFFVPTDQVWVNAQEFYSGGQDGTSTKTIPQMNLGLNGEGPVAAGDLACHMGVSPTGAVTDINLNVLPLRVYNAIYNWHYRNRDLQTERVVSTADGPDTTTNITLASRLWERDRFTTARTEPQRGDDVMIPGNTSGDIDLGTQPVTLNPTTGIVPNVLTAATHATWSAATSNLQVQQTSSDFAESGGNDMVYDPNGSLETDLDLTAIDFSDATGTIRELEERVAINRFRLRLQQADGSYPDYTLATFGIRSPDIELQKPVLLAQSSSPLQISEVLQTAEGATTPVGEYVGHGIGVAQGHGYKYRCKRHGYIMTIFSVVPKTMYANGFDKEWLRVTKEDYFDPDLDQIGEETIDNREMFTTGTAGDWGYQYRNYCDRSSLDTISGEFQTTLDFYTQARQFTVQPALNSAFVTSDPSDRIFAYGSTQDQIRVKALHDIKMLRVMKRIPNRGIL